MKTSVSRSLCAVLSSAGVLAILIAGTAHADRNGAPIRYAGAEQPSLNTQPSPAATVRSAPSSNSVSVTDQSRVEFHYPDQPDNFFTAQAPAASKPAFDSPITFSPVDSVVSAATAAPQVVPSPQPLSIVAGGAGAAVSVASKVAKAPAQPIRIASLQTQAATSTGKPLTLSRVRANRDAAIKEETGRASIYTDGFNGQPTANGEIFDETAMTAAHPSLPLPSLVQVVNQENGREVVVRVNDRGPFDGKRIVELSPRAGSVLGLNKGSSATVRLRYLGPAPVHTNNTFASNSVENESLPPVIAEPVIAPPVYEAPTYLEPSPTALQASAPLVGVGNVYIQAGSFADIANAQSLTAAFDRSMSVKIEEARVNGGDYFRVLIGPFKTMDAAEVQRAQLSRAGIADGFLTHR